jgi:DNA-binding NarL/FixJ family response regulator
MSASEAQRERIGLRFRLPTIVSVLETAMNAARAVLGAAAIDAAWDAGKALRPAQAVAEALEPFASPAIATISSLTPRETEILTLLAAGLTDPDIAASLFISVRTVENHVAHILTKFSVRTRTAAVSAAISAGVIAVNSSPSVP